MEKVFKRFIPMRVGIDVLACRKLAKRHMRIGMSHQEPYWCQLPLKKKKKNFIHNLEITEHRDLWVWQEALPRCEI